VSVAAPLSVFPAPIAVVFQLPTWYPAVGVAVRTWVKPTPLLQVAGEIEPLVAPTVAVLVTDAERFRVIRKKVTLTEPPLVVPVVTVMVRAAPAAVGPGSVYVIVPAAVLFVPTLPVPQELTYQPAEGVAVTVWSWVTPLLHPAEIVPPWLPVTEVVKARGIRSNVTAIEPPLVEPVVTVRERAVLVVSVEPSVLAPVIPLFAPRLAVFQLAIRQPAMGVAVTGKVSPTPFHHPAEIVPPWLPVTEVVNSLGIAANATEIEPPFVAPIRRVKVLSHAAPPATTVLPVPRLAVSQLETYQPAVGVAVKTRS
jgi:hypothetical protein